MSDHGISDDDEIDVPKARGIKKARQQQQGQTLKSDPGSAKYQVPPANKLLSPGRVNKKNSSLNPAKKRPGRKNAGEEEDKDDDDDDDDDEEEEEAEEEEGKGDVEQSSAAGSTTTFVRTNHSRKKPGKETKHESTTLSLSSISAPVPSSTTSTTSAAGNFSTLPHGLQPITIPVPSQSVPLIEKSRLLPPQHPRLPSVLSNVPSQSPIVLGRALCKTNNNETTPLLLEERDRRSSAERQSDSVLLSFSMSPAASPTYSPVYSPRFSPRNSTTCSQFYGSMSPRPRPNGLSFDFELARAAETPRTQVLHSLHVVDGDDRAIQRSICKAQMMCLCVFLVIAALGYLIINLLVHDESKTPLHQKDPYANSYGNHGGS